MTDDMIFLKAAGWMVFAFVMFMICCSGKKSPPDWPPGEY